MYVSEAFKRHGGSIALRFKSLSGKFLNNLGYGERIPSENSNFLVDNWEKTYDQCIMSISEDLNC